MKINDIRFPYPVLGVNDDIKSEASLVAPDIKKDEDGVFTITFSAEITNKDILSLIKQGKAEYVCEVNCVRTFMRKCYKQDSPDFVIKIPENSIGGGIEFEVTVTVKSPITNYVNSDFHEDYYGYVFNLGIGDLLAHIGSFRYDVEINYANLHVVSSFMVIEQASENDKTTSVYLDNDKISIRLPKQMFEFYRDGAGRDKAYSSIIHSSLVFNALLQALYNFTDYSEKLWARTLDYRIGTEEKFISFRRQDGDVLSFDPEDVDVYELAQALLGDPYQRMFELLDNIANQTNEED